MNEMNSTADDDPGRTDDVDDLIEQYGGLLDKHGPDAAEVKHFYQKYAQEPEFKDLADLLSSLKEESDSRERMASPIQALTRWAVGSMICVPLLLLTAMAYFSINQQSGISALADDVEQRIETLREPIRNQNVQINKLVQSIEQMSNRAVASTATIETQKKQFERLTNLLVQAKESIANLSRHVFDPSQTPPTSNGQPVQVVSTSDDFWRDILRDKSLVLPLRPGDQVNDNRFITTKPKPGEIDEVGKRFYIWNDDAANNTFQPTGWLPNGDGISQDTRQSVNPHEGNDCIDLGGQLTAMPHVGVYFLLDGVWEPTEPFDLFEKLDAQKGDPIKCRFWARAKEPVSVQFKVGGVRRGIVKDSLAFPVFSKWIKLKPEWKMYEIDLTGKDVSSVVGGFLWVVDRAHNGEKDVHFHLDTIYFVNTKKEQEGGASGQRNEK